MRKRGSPILLALIAAACGPTSASSRGTTADGAGDGLPIPEKPWAQMTHAERTHYMADAIVPIMEAEFRAFDGARYASFSCDTCHGPDMAARKFAMPNPSLLALSPTGSPEQQQMVQDHPEMVKFMFNHVLPKMQKMLGHPEFDAEKKTGFGCYACHPAAGPEAVAMEGNNEAQGEELAP